MVGNRRLHWLPTTGANPPKLTKRSSKKRELPEPVFFVDRSLGKKALPDVLRSSGWQIECHETHFPKNANNPEVSDVEWINFAGSKGWMILTADNCTLSNPLETKALMECGTLVFMLGRRNDKTGEQMAGIFAEHKNEIWRKIKNHKPPGIFKVTGGKDGSVRQYIPKYYQPTGSGGL